MRVRRFVIGGRPAWLRRPGADRLLAMWATLFPAPALIDVVRKGTPVRPGMVRRRELLVLPAAGGSKMLVPLDRRAGAAMAMARSSLVNALPQRALWAGLALGLRTGVVHALFHDRLAVEAPAEIAPEDLGDVHATLQRLFGEPVLVGVNVGRARANRKPVLQVLDRGGRTLGFCKVGWNDVTRELIAREAATLEELAGAGFRHLDVPRVLFLHHQDGLHHLVVSSLPGGSWTPFRRPSRTLQAMVEVARSGEPARFPLASSPWWERTATRATALGQTSVGPALAGLLTRLEVGTSGSRVVTFGRWHGDWSPWNMTFGRGRALVWDWERSDPDVPVGFDGLHHALQTTVKHEGMPAALARTRDASDAVLRGFADQVAPARLVLELYLAALYLRYAEDALAIGDPALAASAADILTFLTQLMSSP